MLRFPSIVLLSLLACAPVSRAGDTEKPVVLATIFPICDFARDIAGDFVEIVPLLPPGAEAHSYSPTPADMMRLSRATLFLYLSDDMETWVPGLIADAPSSLLIRTVMPESEATFSPEVEEHRHAADALDEGHHHPLGRDPHIWLDPLRAQAMADRIADALSEADPAHAPEYRANVRALQGRIMELHAEIGKGRDRLPNPHPHLRRPLSPLDTSPSATTCRPCPPTTGSPPTPSLLPAPSPNSSAACAN